MLASREYEESEKKTLIFEVWNQTHSFFPTLQKNKHRKGIKDRETIEISPKSMTFSFLGLKSDSDSKTTKP